MEAWPQQGTPLPGSLAGISAVNVGQLAETEAVDAGRVSVAVHCDCFHRVRDLERLPYLLVQLKVGLRAPELRGWEDDLKKQDVYGDANPLANICVKIRLRNVHLQEKICKTMNLEKKICLGLHVLQLLEKMCMWVKHNKNV